MRNVCFEANRDISTCFQKKERCKTILFETIRTCFGQPKCDEIAFRETGHDVKRVSEKVKRHEIVFGETGNDVKRVSNKPKCFKRFPEHQT